MADLDDLIAGMELTPAFVEGRATQQITVQYPAVIPASLGAFEVDFFLAFAAALPAGTLMDVALNGVEVGTDLVMDAWTTAASISTACTLDLVALSTKAGDTDVWEFIFTQPDPAVELTAELEKATVPEGAWQYPIAFAIDENMTFSIAISDDSFVTEDEIATQAAVLQIECDQAVEWSSATPATAVAQDNGRINAIAAGTSVLSVELASNALVTDDITLTVIGLSSYVTGAQILDYIATLDTETQARFAAEQVRTGITIADDAVALMTAELEMICHVI